MEYAKMKQYHDATGLSIVCARCLRLIVGKKFLVGFFTYGSCCILTIEEEERAKKEANSTR